MQSSATPTGAGQAETNCTHTPDVHVSLMQSAPVWHALPSRPVPAPEEEEEEAVLDEEAPPPPLELVVALPPVPVVLPLEPVAEAPPVPVVPPLEVVADPLALPVVPAVAVPPVPPVPTPTTWSQAAPATREPITRARAPPPCERARPGAHRASIMEPSAAAAMGQRRAGAIAQPRPCRGVLGGEWRTGSGFMKKSSRGLYWAEVLGGAAGETHAHSYELDTRSQERDARSQEWDA